MQTAKINKIGKGSLYITVPQKVAKYFKWNAKTKLWIDWSKVYHDTSKMNNKIHNSQTDEVMGEKQNDRTTNKCRTSPTTEQQTNTEHRERSSKDFQSRRSNSESMGKYGSSERQIPSNAECTNFENIPERRELGRNQQHETERPTKSNVSSRGSIQVLNTETGEYRPRLRKN